MAKKQTTPADSFADMFHPDHGVHDSVSLSDMPPGFTPVGVNVRLYEELTGRGRGGSRAGLSKFISEQHSGNHEIQLLTSIVTVDGSMAGWSFNGIDQGFPGIYGGIGFLDPIPFGGFGFAGFGGGGYQPNAQISRILTMGYRIVKDGFETIVMSTDSEVTLRTPAGTWVNIQVFVRITDQDGRGMPPPYQAFENVTLLTSPSGEIGDQVTNPTQFDLDNPPIGVLGLAEFPVSRQKPGEVEYSGEHKGFVAPPVQFFSRIPVKIVWTPYRVTTTASAPSAPLNTPVTITGHVQNADGTNAPNLRVILHTIPEGQDGFGDVAITDAGGNVSFTVQEPSPETVEYRLTEESESVDNVSDVTVSYDNPNFTIDLDVEDFIGDHTAASYVSRGYTFSPGLGSWVKATAVTLNGVYGVGGPGTLTGSASGLGGVYNFWSVAAHDTFIRFIGDNTAAGSQDVFDLDVTWTDRGDGTFEPTDVVKKNAFWPFYQPYGPPPANPEVSETIRVNGFV